MSENTTEKPADATTGHASEPQNGSDIAGNLGFVERDAHGLRLRVQSPLGKGRLAGSSAAL